MRVILSRSSLCLHRVSICDSYCSERFSEVCCIKTDSDVSLCSLLWLIVPDYMSS